MKKINAKKFKNTVGLLALDLVFAVTAFILARTIIFFRVDVTTPSRYVVYEPAIMVASVVALVTCLIIFDSYNVIWKYAGRVEFLKFLFAYLCAFLYLCLVKLIFKVVVGAEFWMPLMLMYLLFSGLMSGTVRFFSGVMHYVKHLSNIVGQKSAKSAARTIVIGAGYTGSLAINRFINNPNDGYIPVAVLDDDTEKHGKRIYGINIEGDITMIEDVVKRYRAKMIVIAIMTVTKSQLKRIYSYCYPLNIPIKIMPTIKDANNVGNEVVSLRDIKIEELLGRDEFKLRQEFIDAALKNRIVMVTGGAGSIGSELCRQALIFGCKHLIIFDQHENGMFFLDGELSKTFDKSRYTLVMGSVREKFKLDETIKKFAPSVIFHAAAYKHVPMMEISATEAVKNNVMGTLNVIECADENSVDKLVLISTDKAVNPSNIMGASKRIAEMLIQTRGKVSKTQMAAVRFGNVLGSNGSVIPTFLEQIKDGGPVTLTDREIMRYFMSIPEAVRLVLQTGAFAKNGEIFVLDMGDPIYIYDLACDLIRINGLIPEEDVEIKITGLRPGEKMFEELRYDNEAVDITEHEGVFVNKLSEINRKEFDKNLNNLIEYALKEDEEKTTEMIFTIVPSEFRKKCSTKVSCESATESGDTREFAKA